MTGKLIILICVLLMPGCNTISRHSLEGKVPAETLGYIEINNTSRFIEELDIFMMKTGLNISWEGQSLTSLLKKNLSKVIPEPRLDIFNLDKPIGMALLPPSPGYEEYYGGLLFLPMKYPGSYNILKRSLSTEFSDSMRESDGYAIIYSNPLIFSETPPEKSLRMKPFTEYKNGSVSTMINIREFAKSMNLNLYSIFMSFNSIDPRHYNMIPFYEELIRETDKAWINASLVAGGVLFKGDIELNRGSSLKKLLKKHKEVINTTRFAGLLPGNGMVHSFSNINQEDMIHTYWWLLNHMFPPHLLAEMRMKEVFQKPFTLYEFLGEQSAMSLDILFNGKKYINKPDTDQGKNDLFSVLETITDFRFVEIQELKNRTEYLDSFSENISEMNQFYSKFHSMGFIISFRMAEKRQNDFEWIEISPEITVTDKEVMKKSLENVYIVPIINKILSKSTLLFHATDSKGITVSQDVGLDILKEMVKNNAYPGYTMRDKIRETHPELTPDNANFLIHLDTDYFRKDNPDLNKMKNVVFSEHSSGIWMYLINKKGRIEMGYYADLIGLMELNPAEQKLQTASLNY